MALGTARRSRPNRSDLIAQAAWLSTRDFQLVEEADVKPAARAPQRKRPARARDEAVALHTCDIELIDPAELAPQIAEAAWFQDESQRISHGPATELVDALDDVPLRVPSSLFERPSILLGLVFGAFVLGAFVVFIFVHTLVPAAPQATLLAAAPLAPTVTTTPAPLAPTATATPAPTSPTVVAAAAPLLPPAPTVTAIPTPAQPVAHAPVAAASPIWTASLAPRAPTVRHVSHKRHHAAIRHRAHAAIAAPKKARPAAKSDWTDPFGD